MAFVCGGFEPENELFDDYVDYGENAFLNYQGKYKSNEILYLIIIKVAETDYENYSLVIDCHNVVVDDVDMHVEVIYLLTRTRDWGPNNQVKVQELLAIPSNLGLVIDNMFETKQTDCDKYDLP